jgi:microcystin-dependent protein
MPATPSTKHAIARPADADFINTWPATMRSGIDKLDGLIATFITTTPRPAAGVSGRFHRATDGTISFDTGTVWVEIARVTDVALPPVGAIVVTASTVLPSNGRYAWADGSLIDRTVYTEYFAAVGHAYNGGVDPGSNLVRLPDKRGRHLLGANNFGVGAPGASNARATAARGAAGGEVLHTLLTAGMPSHSHGGGSHQHSMPFTPLSNSGSHHSWTQNSGAATVNMQTNVVNASGAVINTEGGGQGHNNLPPYEADNVLVRIL